MSDEEGTKKEGARKSKFLQAYLSQRETVHQRAYSPTPESQHVDVTRPVVKPRSMAPPRKRKRLPIKELAMQRSRTYLRPDKEAPREAPSEEPSEHAPYPGKLSPFRYRDKTGFKLVKDGAARRRTRIFSKPRKRISLYDLYAPRTPVEEEGAVEEEHVEEEGHEEFWTKPPLETKEVPEGEEMDHEEAASLLWGTKRRPVREPAHDELIIKEGPEGEPSHVTEEGEVMEAGTMTEPEHARARVQESAVSVDEEVREEAPQAPPAPRVMEDKTAHGDICPSCGSNLHRHNQLVVCNGCGDKGCHTCNRYDLGHQSTNVYYDYSFDFPLCIGCYEKAFAIQKQLGKAKMCFGNGNLTYALYYAQNALKLDPESKYAESALDLIQKIEEARKMRHTHDAAWKKESKRISRSRWQDPAWEK
jgi:hypothetical protein